MKKKSFDKLIVAQGAITIGKLNKKKFELLLFQPTFSKNIDICEYFEISHKSATLMLNVILKELCDNQQNQLLSIIKDLNLRLMENTYKYCTRTDPLLTFSCLEEIDWTNCCKWRENKVYGFQTV